MANRQVEEKVFAAYTTKVDADAGIVEAIVNTFGIVDLGDDVVMNGSFTKTLLERGLRVKVVDSHNTRSIMNVLGKPLEMRELSREELPPEILEEWPEATGGLWTKTQYLLDTPEGLGAFTRIKAGAVNEYSFMYEVLQYEYKKVDWRGKKVNARLLKEIKLYEYGPVVFGMNPATLTTDAKRSEELMSETTQPQPTAGDGKEMTPQGAVRRLGDYLVGRMRLVTQMVGNEYLMWGTLNADQVKAVNLALDTAMATFTAGLPEDVNLLPLGGGYGYYYDAATPPDGQKAEPDIHLQHSPIPIGNGFIEQLTQHILGKLAAPGALAGPDGNQAGPPTDEARQALLANIEQDMQEE